MKIIIIFSTKLNLLKRALKLYYKNFTGKHKMGRKKLSKIAAFKKKVFFYPFSM